MVQNNSAMAEWTTFLEALRISLDEARARWVDIEAEVARLESETQAVEDSMAAYRAHHHLPHVEEILACANDQGETLTARRRAFLLETARRNSGRIILRNVRDDLVQAGLFRDREQFRQQVGRLINDMECWERLPRRRGVYRLLERAEENQRMLNIAD